MRNVIKFLLYVSMLFILFGLAINISAHSGRTDENGGHYDRDTGSYHYHHGMFAHQHPNGICPYSVDSIPKNKSNTGYSSSYSNNYTNYSIETKTDRNGSNTKTTYYIIIVVILFTPIGWCIIYCISKFFKYITNKCKEVKKYNAKIHELKNKRKYFLHEYKNLISLYNDAPIDMLKNAYRNRWISLNTVQYAVNRKEHIKRYIEIIAAGCAIIDDTIRDLKNRKMHYDDEIIHMILSKDKFYEELPMPDEIEKNKTNR